MALTKAKLQEQFDNGEYDIGVGTGTLAIADGGTGATTAAGALTNLGAAPSDYWKTIYPVGAIYMSVVSNSPNTLFGGTWESLGGRFLLGADGTYGAGTTGGSAASTFTLDSSAHAQIMTGGALSTGVVAKYIACTAYTANRASSGTESTISNSYSYGVPVVGTTTSKSIMNPYLSVYMWKRTA